MSVIRRTALVLATMTARPFVGASKVLATFDGATGTTFNWEAVNDPVMGGQSNSTFTVDSVNKVGNWAGTVRIVPFLKAPGFCTVRTKDATSFPDVSGTAGLVLNGLSRSDSQVTGFQLQLMTKGGRSGFKEGTYVGNVTIPASQNSSAFAAWDDFKLTWRGEDIKGPALSTQLDQITQIGLGTAFPGTTGDFDLAFTSFIAVDSPPSNQA